MPRRIFFWLRQKLQCFALRPSGDGKMLVVEPDELLNTKIRIFSKSGDPYGNPLPAGKATAVAAYHRHAAKSRLSIPVRKTRKKRNNPKGLFLFLCFHYTIDERRDLRFRKGRMCARNPPGGVLHVQFPPAGATVRRADYIPKRGTLDQ